MSLIIEMTKDFAIDISNWIYEDPYSMYSFENNSETILELMSGDYYAFIDDKNQLSGYFCFDKSAQIPTHDYTYSEEALDIGLGMNPLLCGKGLGYSFLNVGIGFARKKFQAKKYRLTVASFNRRAISLYEKVGFIILKTVNHSKSGDEFYIMIREERD
jgi:ribosomal-protein-alanine N-acetyltransferase